MEMRVLYHESLFKGLLEDLESRIAPATFLISGGTVVNEAGQDVTTAHQDDATAFDASKAALLKKGDLLAVDTNANGVFDLGADALVAQINDGAALIFFFDADESGGIDADEISGMAVSDKFGGVFNGVVHGDIATLLNIDFTLSTTKFADAASISKLTINGSVDGNIGASGSISGLTINSPDGVRSVGTIFTGDALGATCDVTFGENAVGVDVSTAAAKSTSISKIVIHGGVDVIAAGSNPGKTGGSILSVAIDNDIAASDLEIVAGAGSVGKKTTAGGSISGLSIGGNAFNEISITSGDGGSGYMDMGLNGGAGGSIKKVSMVTEVSNLVVLAGNGGDALFKAKSGAGGKIAGLDALIANGGSASITGGDGGDAEKTAAAGGSVSAIKLLGADIVAINILGGNGGSSVGADTVFGGGGAGGGIAKILVQSTIATGSIGSLNITGGKGGDASFGYFYTPNSYRYVGAKGGKGGSIKTVLVSSLVAQAIDMAGGDGGVSTIKAAGPAGGSVSGVTAQVTDLADSHITGGVGGSSDEGATGPDGKVSKVNVTMGMMNM
jgi:hypothetical protein